MNEPLVMAQQRLKQHNLSSMHSSRECAMSGMNLSKFLKNSLSGKDKIGSRKMQKILMHFWNCTLIVLLRERQVRRYFIRRDMTGQKNKQSNLQRHILANQDSKIAEQSLIQPLDTDNSEFCDQVARQVYHLGLQNLDLFQIAMIWLVFVVMVWLVLLLVAMLFGNSILKNFCKNRKIPIIVGIFKIFL